MASHATARDAPARFGTSLSPVAALDGGGGSLPLGGRRDRLEPGELVCFLLPHAAGRGPIKRQQRPGSRNGREKSLPFFVLRAGESWFTGTHAEWVENHQRLGAPRVVEGNRGKLGSRSVLGD